MWMKQTCLASLAMLLATICIAGEPPDSAAFQGGGRACAGGFYVRKTTIEWKSTFSVCKRTAFDVIERTGAGDDARRIVYRLSTRSPSCRYEVVELEQVSLHGWDVTGYPSQAAFEHRASADASATAMTLSCPMVRLR
jgi:hypothetical protein